MVTCQSCGARNSDDAALCVQCGIPLAGQRRSTVDAKRNQIRKVALITLRIVVVVVIIAAAPIVYRKGGAAFFNYKLNMATDSAKKECGGPLDDTATPERLEKFNQCIATNEEYLKAKQDYDKFAKP